MPHSVNPVSFKMIINFSVCNQMKTASYSWSKFTRRMYVGQETLKLPRNTSPPELNGTGKYNYSYLNNSIICTFLVWTYWLSSIKFNFAQKDCKAIYAFLHKYYFIIYFKDIKECLHSCSFTEQWFWLKLLFVIILVLHLVFQSLLPVQQSCLS